MTIVRSMLVAVVLLVAARPAAAVPVLLNFEDGDQGVTLIDGDPLADQFAGLGIIFDGGLLTLTDGSIGGSLNQDEFPPLSGVNVAGGDAFAPLTISFTGLVTSVTGFFTYNGQLTMTALDAAGNVVSTTTSAFQSNTVISGDPGSLVNELLAVTGTSIASVVLFSGGEFSLDDLTVDITPVDTTPVPEPTTAGLLMLGLAAVAGRRLRRGARA